MVQDQEQLFETARDEVGIGSNWRYYIPAEDTYNYGSKPIGEHLWEKGQFSEAGLMKSVEEEESQGAYDKTEDNVWQDFASALRAIATQQGVSSEDYEELEDEALVYYSNHIYYEFDDLVAGLWDSILDTLPSKTVGMSLQDLQEFSEEHTYFELEEVEGVLSKSDFHKLVTDEANKSTDQDFKSEVESGDTSDVDLYEEFIGHEATLLSSGNIVYS